MAISDKDWDIMLQSSGVIKPSDDGFFGEFSDGFCYSFYGLFNSQKLEVNQQWRAPADMSTMSHIGRTLGEGWFITLPVLALLVWLAGRKLRRSIKQRRLVHEAVATQLDEARVKAIEEIESGNLDKLTWANALIKANGNEEKAKSIYLKIRK